MNLEQIMFIGMSAVLSIGAAMDGGWLSFMVAFGFIIGLGTVHMHIERNEALRK